jgi:hypothetical protein
MAKKTQRARKRLPKAEPAAGEAATANSLTGSAVTDLFGSSAPSNAPGAFASLASAVDPFANEQHCRYSARTLFDKIKEHHGIDLARRIFKSLSAPRKRETPKRLRDLMLLDTYEMLQSQYPGWGRERAARYIDKIFPLEYGKNAGAVFEQLRRLQRKRRKKS